MRKVNYIIKINKISRLLYLVSVRSVSVKDLQSGVTQQSVLSMYVVKC